MTDDTRELSDNELESLGIIGASSMKPRRYIVTLFSYNAFSGTRGRTVEETAYSAKDAAFQAKLSASKGERVGAVGVPPMRQHKQLRVESDGEGGLRTVAGRFTCGRCGLDWVDGHDSDGFCRRVD